MFSVMTRSYSPFAVRHAARQSDYVTEKKNNQGNANISNIQLRLARSMFEI